MWKRRFLSDDMLFKRAGHAGRNMTALAILATVLTLVMGLCMTYTGILVYMLLAFILITAGLWILAVAARRGSSSSVGIVLAVMSCQLLISVVAYCITVVRQDSNSSQNFVGIIIPLAIIAVLASSRNVLLELKRRGLWKNMFDPYRSTKGLCILGGAIYIIGVVGLYAGLFVPAVQTAYNAKERAREMGYAKAVMDIIKREEAGLFIAMHKLASSNDEETIHTVLSKVNALEEKIDSIKLGFDSSLYAILKKYKAAIHDWKEGLRALSDQETDRAEALKLLESGDQHRLEATREFERRYAEP